VTDRAADARPREGHAETPGVVVGNYVDKYTGTNPLISWLTRRFLAELDDVVATVAATQPHARVLEVGCGEGEIARRLADRFDDVLALDLPDADLRADWAELTGPRFLHADVLELPLADDAVDVTLAVEVLEHVTDPGRALAELARVTAGDLIASVPREPVFRAGNLLAGRHVRALGNTPGHLNHWSTRAFTRFLTTAGSVTEIRTPLPWTIAHVRLPLTSSSSPDP
jgi:SAM-dependent methyltransferase